MKAKHSIRIAMPIEGVDYSQLEYMNEWEIEGNDADEVMSNLKVMIDEFVEQKLEEVGGKFKTKLEDLNSKIEKAREEFIKLRKTINEQ